MLNLQGLSIFIAHPYFRILYVGSLQIFFSLTRPQFVYKMHAC